MFSMSFIDQENLSSGMGPILGGIQTVLQVLHQQSMILFVMDIALVF